MMTTWDDFENDSEEERANLALVAQIETPAERIPPEDEVESDTK